jgi:large subunit ribosomal protein L29
MKPKELREKPLEDLREDLRNRRQKLRELRFNLSFGKVKNIRQVHSMKKDIARILTIIKEMDRKNKKDT